MINEAAASICWAYTFIPKRMISEPCSIVSIGLTVRVVTNPIRPVRIVLKAIAAVLSLGWVIAKSRLVELTALAAPKNSVKSLYVVNITLPLAGVERTTKRNEKSAKIYEIRIIEA